MTEDRETEMRARSARRRAAVAARPPDPHAAVERSWNTESRARAAAVRCGCPNTEIGAARTDDGRGWVGLVHLRPDQRWMERHVRERGCRPVVREQP